MVKCATHHAHELFRCSINSLVTYSHLCHAHPLMRSALCAFIRILLVRPIKAMPIISSTVIWSSVRVYVHSTAHFSSLRVMYSKMWTVRWLCCVREAHQSRATAKHSHHEQHERADDATWSDDAKGTYHLWLRKNGAVLSYVYWQKYGNDHKLMQACSIRLTAIDVGQAYMHNRQFRTHSLTIDMPHFGC